GLTQLGSYALIRKSQPISLINQDQRGTSLPLMRNQGRESQREAWSHAAHRRPRVLSWIDRLPARSAHRRQKGGTCCFALDPPGLLIDEAMGPGHVSWPAPHARRHPSQ